MKIYPLNGLIGYKIFESFNSNSYKYAIKFYEHFNISELRVSQDIKSYDYNSFFETSIKEKPMILIREFEEAKGLLLEIQHILNEDNEEVIQNEVIVYLYSKK